MLRRKAEVFAPTDGILKVMRDTDERLVRGVDFSGTEGLEEWLKLSYSRVRVSARDVELAESTGTAITAKVACRMAPGLTPDYDVLMDGRLYELTRLENRGRTCWLWLSEIATDDTCDLLQVQTVRDSHGIARPQEGEPVTVWCRSIATTAAREVPQGVDMLRPGIRLRLRACDYDNETRLRRGGRTYTVTSVESHGRWVDLRCELKVADR